MRICSCLALAGALLIRPATASAADGSMGPTSSGSIMIRVSVAPRASPLGDGTLCLAAPASGYSLRLADSPRAITAVAAAATPCPARGERLALPADLRASGQTLLIVAE